VSKDDGEFWIRVPRTRRSKSFSGVESLVGKAEKKKDEEPVDLEGGTVTEGMEIESLIIPELAARHSERIEKMQNDGANPA
jgi:phosphopantothenate-cysteine ligase